MPVKISANKNFSIGVFAIVFNEKKEALLLKRRDYDLWNLPGGGVEAGETPNQGLKREVMEEVGAKISAYKLCGIYYKKGKDEIVFAYLVKLKPFVFKPTPEARQMAYFPADKLPPNFPANQAERIKDALKFKGIIMPKVQVSGSTRKALRK